MTNIDNFYAKSPQRFSFLKESREIAFKEGKITQEQLDEWIRYADECIRADSVLNPEDEPSLGQDLRSSKVISDKCKASEVYSQNLYAALCNNGFSKNNTTWTCSWRSAGGIVANLREEGDYINWYCSGIGSELPYLAESVVSDEIRKDIESFGWMIVDHPAENL